MTETFLALGLALIAALLALLALFRPVGRSRALTLELALGLPRYDEGLALLAVQAERSDTWWVDADPTERQLIDRALSMWDLAASYVAKRRVDRRTVLDVFGVQIIDLWERAYPYVQHRRLGHPTAWSSLTELYLDAYDRTRRGRQVAPGPHHSISPEEVGQEASAEPVAVAQNAAAATFVNYSPEPEPVADPAQAESDRWAAVLRQEHIFPGRVPTPLNEHLEHLRGALKDLQPQWPTAASTPPAAASPARRPETGRPARDPVRRPTPASVIDLVEVSVPANLPGD